MEINLPEEVRPTLKGKSTIVRFADDVVIGFESKEEAGKEKLKKISEWCRENRHSPISWQHQKLCQKLKGHYAYYGITGNIDSLQTYLHEVTRIWKKWLNRRSWRGHKLTWDIFKERLKEHIPLPPAKIVHSIYAAKP